MPRMDAARLVLGLAVMAVGGGVILGNRPLGRVTRKYGTQNWIRPGIGDRIYREDRNGRVWAIVVTGIWFVMIGFLIVALSI